MTYGYIRFSTLAQEETQQIFALQEYAKTKGLTIDAVEKDEGISGGVSYKDRNLYGLVKKMVAGDTLVVTEISRIGRSMSDINKFVNDELVPRRIRLIVTKMGIDLNCAQISAIDQMLIYAFSFSAQLEKEMIVQRTQSALDARKRLIEEDGGFVSKAGNFCTKLGAPKGHDTLPARLSSMNRRMGDAKEWRDMSPLYNWATTQLRNGVERKKIVAKAREKYDKDPKMWGTRTGKPLTEALLCVWAKEVLPLI